MATKLPSRKIQWQHLCKRPTIAGITHVSAFIPLFLLVPIMAVSSFTNGFLAVVIWVALDAYLNYLQYTLIAAIARFRLAVRSLLLGRRRTRPENFNLKNRTL